MLSRIAESMFWIGRYLERADGTSRILDVYVQLLLEDPWVDEDWACRSLLSIMGSPAPEGPVTRNDVIDRLGIDRSQPSSIASSLWAARENARRARETVSVDLWECLNTTTAQIPAQVIPSRVHSFFRWTHDRVALAVGISDSVMSRSESWHFFTLGRSLERADMTARLLATHSLDAAGGASWTTILRSCGAYEGYLRAYRGAPARRHAAQFLLVDDTFPRSVLFSLARARECVRSLDHGSARGTAGGRADLELGRAMSGLEYRPVDEIVADLAASMTAVRTATSAVSEAVAERYFPTQAIPTWVGERS